MKLNSVIYANRGLVYSKMNKNEDAQNDFTKSIELNPQYFKAYLRRGDARNQIGDFEGAEADYRKVAELEPSQT